MENLNQKIERFNGILEKIKENIDEDKNMEESSRPFNQFTNEILNEIKSINKQLSEWETDSFSSQLSTLLFNILNNYGDMLEHELDIHFETLFDKYTSILSFMPDIQKEIKRINYLLYVRDKNIVLVGGNGSGKSSFASYLKNTLADNIVVIPAQKFLFFNLNIRNLHLIERSDINAIQKENLIDKGKTEALHLDVYAVERSINELSSVFSKFITMIANEQIIAQNTFFETTSSQSNLEVIDKDKNEAILSILNSLWMNLVPDIKFILDPANKMLEPVKNGKSYNLNSMSDGEKAMLFYIAYVLLAEPNSFIVIDEPETFLNASNYNRLWDTLEKHRPDCKFIYISHTVDFIVSRDNVDLLWCKEFTYPDEWEIEPVYAESELAEDFPKELLSELLGARKPILFCEGTKSSLDYSIYSSLFTEDVIVYPVGGHNKVIEYTKSYNLHSSKLNGNKAVGIIDHDLMSTEQIESYKNDSVYTLAFNEIEMLLLTEEVMYKVLTESRFTEDKAKERIDNFKSRFINTMSSRIDKVLFERKKKYIDTQLSNYRINESNTTEDIIDELKKMVENLITNDDFEQFQLEINKLIEEPDYEKLLKKCPLKTEISKGLANKELESNYQDIALHRIKIDKILSEQIRSLHFSDLKSEIMSLS